MNYLVIDTEFSSFKVEQGDLLQLGCIAVVDGELHKFDEYARPINKNAWSIEAEKVHGISWEKAQTFQPIEEMAEKFKKFLDKFDTVFTNIGWNHSTDKKYIDKLIRKHALQKSYYYKSRPDWIDVLKMVRERKEQIRLKSYTLSSVAKYFNIKFKDAHNALYDAWITWKIYELLKGIRSDKSDFIQLSHEEKLNEIEKREKYLSMDYIQNSNGEVFLTKKATSNPEAMKVIFEELWTLYVEL